jgi:TfoX/Sxy family transcriptional regulator of competence genes
VSRADFEAMKEQLVAAVGTWAPELEVQFKPMFGGACAYVKGRVFASLSNVGLALKLPAAAQADLLLEEGARPLQYEPDAPPSKHYVVVPVRLRADSEALALWVRQSVEHALAQPAPRSKRKPGRGRTKGIW